MDAPFALLLLLLSSTIVSLRATTTKDTYFSSTAAAFPAKFTSFSPGPFPVTSFLIPKSDDASSGPPRPLLVFAPVGKANMAIGQVPLVIFLHGFNLKPCFYSQLLSHVASHGYLVAAPELYSFTVDQDATGDIVAAVATASWSKSHLRDFLPGTVLPPDISSITIAGHSRGGKDAFGVALGLGGLDIGAKAVILLDPVDGTSNTSQTPPKLLKHKLDSIHVGAPLLVVGSGLGPLGKLVFGPPCAATWVGHEFFFSDSQGPAFHLRVKDYGHMDMLDDVTFGSVCQQTTTVTESVFFRTLALAADNLCLNGPSRPPMRLVNAGVAVSFLEGVFRGRMANFLDLLTNPASFGAAVDELGMKNGTAPPKNTLVA